MRALPDARPSATRLKIENYPSLEVCLHVFRSEKFAQMLTFVRRVIRVSWTSPQHHITDIETGKDVRK